MPRAKVSESRLWSWMTSAKMIFREVLHMSRLENSIQNGFPDVEGCLCGNEFWIELKCAVRPKKKETKIKPKFQPQQIPWMRRRTKAGGRRVYVLIQVGSGSDARRYLLPAHAAEKLESDGLTEDELYAQCICDPEVNPGQLVSTAAQLPYPYKEV